MKTLKIDDKWSVEYDPANNDCPTKLLRHGEDMTLGLGNWTNDVVAMFYALLESTQRVGALKIMKNSEYGTMGAGKTDLAQLAIEIHTDNVIAGWWTDLSTGESARQTRNRPEMLMLAVSEIAEAAEGEDGVKDDKLPHLPMYDVELGDFAIRQLDQIGAEVACGQEMPDWAHLGTWEDDLFSALVSRSELRTMSRASRLMELVKSVAAAMEHYRKGRLPNYVRCMAEGVLLAFAIAEIEGIDLLDIIEQKRAFNRTREDHKLENRRQSEGKKF